MRHARRDEGKRRSQGLLEDRARKILVPGRSGRGESLGLNKRICAKARISGEHDPPGGERTKIRAGAGEINADPSSADAAREGIPSSGGAPIHGDDRMAEGA